MQDVICGDLITFGTASYRVTRLGYPIALHQLQDPSCRIPASALYAAVPSTNTQTSISFVLAAETGEWFPLSQVATTVGASAAPPPPIAVAVDTPMRIAEGLALDSVSAALAKRQKKNTPTDKDKGEGKTRKQKAPEVGDSDAPEPEPEPVKPKPKTPSKKKALVAAQIPSCKALAEAAVGRKDGDLRPRYQFEPGSLPKLRATLNQFNPRSAFVNAMLTIDMERLATNTEMTTDEYGEIAALQTAYSSPHSLVNALLDPERHTEFSDEYLRGLLDATRFLVTMTDIPKLTRKRAANGKQESDPVLASLFAKLGYVPSPPPVP